jgi:hypothetical protein
VNRDFSTPPLYDLPEGRLAERKEHLLAEIQYRSRPGLRFPSFTLTRPRLAGAAAAASLAVVAAVIAVVATSGPAAQRTQAAPRTLIGGAHQRSFPHSHGQHNFTGTSPNCGIEPQQSYPQPPPGFDPTTATATQLQEYGFPPRPAGDSTSGAQQAWLQAMAAWKQSDTPQPTCSTATRQPPATVAHSPSSGSHRRP